jgi:hypothetical protein
MFIPDPNFSIPDPGSKRFRIPHQRIHVFLTQRNVSKLSEIYGPGCSSRISDLDFSPIQDPGSRGQKAPDPGSGSATLINRKQLKIWARGGEGGVALPSPFPTIYPFFAQMILFVLKFTSKEVIHEIMRTQ